MTVRPGLAGVALSSLLLGAARSQTPDDTIGSQHEGIVVRNVVVWAAVNDRRGRPETDLDLDDFRLFEDGVHQRIASLDLGSETPLSVQILMDASKSMEISGAMAVARRAAIHLLSRLGKQDGASLWLFSGRRTYRDCEMGTPALRIREALQALSGYGETILRDSMFRALLSREGSASSRRAVFLFSDGKDNASEIGEEDIASLAGSLNVPIHAIILSPRPERDTDPAEYASLRSIVELSGGVLTIIYPLDEEGPMKAIDDALKRLRSSYVLEYSPEGSPSKGFHRIEVRTSCRRCTVFHRKGYYAR